MQDTAIREIMTTDLITINHDDTLTQVSEIFKTKGFHHILVLNNDGDLEGMISSTDMERTRSGASFFRNPKKEEFDATILRSMRACDIMTKDVVTLQSSDSIKRAYEVFKKNKFHAIPIVSKGILEGILTPIDILDYFFNQN